MSLVIKKLRAYWPFSRGAMQVLMSYKANFFMFVLGGLLKTFVIYYLWKAVYNNSSNSVINGFTISDMMVYIFISSITSIAINCNTERTIGREVREGSIAMNLIRPINYQTRMLFETLGTFIYQFLFISIPVLLALLAYRFFTFGALPPDAWTILLYFLSLLLGFLIMFLFNFSFGLISFYTTGVWGLWFVKGAVIRFVSGELVPIVFFPFWLQTILKFLPFNSMNYVPVMIYLKKFNGNELIRVLGMQIFWVFVLFFISNILWNKAIKKLTILGG